MRTTFCVSTYGCKVNQYESQLIREGFIAAGCAETNSTDADIVVVNTCTVTAQSDGKIRQAVRRIRRSNQNNTIIITGCGANRHADLFGDDENIYLATGNSWKERYTQLQSVILRVMSGDIHPYSPETNFSIPESITGFGRHTRAFVKAQDGCDSFCSYCTIPLVRGRSVSRDLGEVCEEVNRLLESGYKEIVLTGIHLGQYRDSNHNRLDALLRALTGLPYRYRLRLSSIEPQDITSEVIEAFAGSEKITSHLHLPIQHGHNDILRAMNRRYTLEQYESLVDSLRSAKRDILLTTDLIVGFPTETDQQFEHSLEAILRIGYLKVHVFPFSSRPGTKAASMTDTVPAVQIKQRTAEAIKLTTARADEIKTGFIDRILPVLVESRKNKYTGMWTGFTPQYIKVNFYAGQPCANKIVPVRLTGLHHDAMTGELIHADTSELD